MIIAFNEMIIHFYNMFMIIILIIFYFINV